MSNHSFLMTIHIWQYLFLFSYGLEGEGLKSVNLENYIHSVHKASEQLLRKERNLGVVQMEHYMLQKSIRSTESKSYLSVGRNSFFFDHILFVSRIELIEIREPFYEIFHIFSFLSCKSESLRFKMC